MITPKIEETAKLMVERIEKSNLDVDDKSQLIEQIQSNKEACNGYSQEEKIQALSENGFATSVILAKIMMMLKSDHTTTWKDVIVKALNSWKVVIIVGIISALLAFHPEIAQVIASFAH